MRGHHHTNHGTGGYIVSQKEMKNRITDKNRSYKCKKTKSETLVLGLSEIIHIQLQPGDKHDINDPDGGKQVHRRVLRQNIQSVWPDDHAGDNQTDNTGNTDFSQENGR